MRTTVQLQGESSSLFFTRRPLGGHQELEHKLALSGLPTCPPANNSYCSSPSSYPSSPSGPYPFHGSPLLLRMPQVCAWHSQLFLYRPLEHSYPTPDSAISRNPMHASFPFPARTMRGPCSVSPVTLCISQHLSGSHGPGTRALGQTPHPSALCPASSWERSLWIPLYH